MGVLRDAGQGKEVGVTFDPRCLWSVSCLGRNLSPTDDGSTLHHDSRGAKSICRGMGLAGQLGICTAAVSVERPPFLAVIPAEAQDPSSTRRTSNWPWYLASTIASHRNWRWPRAPSFVTT